jgi:tetratricopeptide (TPR) repeat protein
LKSVLLCGPTALSFVQIAKVYLVRKDYLRAESYALKALFLYEGKPKERRDPKKGKEEGKNSEGKKEEKGLERKTSALTLQTGLGKEGEETKGENYFVNQNDKDGSWEEKTEADEIEDEKFTLQYFAHSAPPSERSQPLIVLGEIYAKHNKVEDAINCFKRVLEIDRIFSPLLYYFL